VLLREERPDAARAVGLAIGFLKVLIVVGAWHGFGG